MSNTRTADWEALADICFRATSASERARTTELLLGAVYGLSTKVTTKRWPSLSHDDRCEIAQLTAIKVWQRLGQLRDERSMFAWVRRACTTVALDFMRARRRRPESFLPDELELYAETASPETQVAARQSLRLVASDGRALSRSLAVEFERTLLGGEEPAETAKALGIARGLVDQRVSRIRQCLPRAA